MDPWKAFDQINDERLRHLASEPDSEVFQYVYSTPDKTTDTSHAMAYARDAFKARRKLGASVSDLDARELIRKGDIVLDLFSRTHPKIFEMVTDLDRGTKHFEVLKELAAVRKQVETGLNARDAEVHVSNLLQKECARPPKEGEIPDPNNKNPE